MLRASPVELGFTRDVGDHPASSLEIERLAGPVDDTELVRDCIELAHALGALAIDRDDALARFAGATCGIEIPVYSDAFPLLASEMIASWQAPYHELHAEVDAGEVDELLAIAYPDARLTFALGLEDDVVFAAIADHEPGAPVVACWDEPDSEIWMTYAHPSGGMADDGRVYTITAAARELAIETVIDHMGTENAAAWLSGWAGVAVAHRGPP